MCGSWCYASHSRAGTVPTAVAKGAQQAGVFVFSHVIYCHLDQEECIDYNYGDSTWNKMQKSVAAVACVLGCMIYALDKKKATTGNNGKVQNDIIV